MPGNTRAQVSRPARERAEEFNTYKIADYKKGYWFVGKRLLGECSDDEGSRGDGGWLIFYTPNLTM